MPCANEHVAFPSGSGYTVTLQSDQVSVRSLSIDVGFTLELSPGQAIDIHNPIADLECEQSECSSSQYSVDGGRSCIALTTCDPQLEYETVPATPSSDRECVSYTVCSAGTFEAVAPTTSTDRECPPLTVCSAGTFESVAPTTTTDRQCQSITECVAGVSYEERPPSSFEDRICAPVTTCSVWEYESAPPSVISDRGCTTVTNCTLGQTYETSPPSSSADRFCSPTTQCQLGSTYETSAPTLISDRRCFPVRDCQLNEEEVQAPTLTSDRVCVRSVVELTTRVLIHNLELDNFQGNDFRDAVAVTLSTATSQSFDRPNVNLKSVVSGSVLAEFAVVVREDQVDETFCALRDIVVSGALATEMENQNEVFSETVVSLQEQSGCPLCTCLRCAVDPFVVVNGECVATPLCDGEVQTEEECDGTVSCPNGGTLGVNGLGEQVCRGNILCPLGTQLTNGVCQTTCDLVSGNNVLSSDMTCVPVKTCDPGFYFNPEDSANSFCSNVNECAEQGTCPDSVACVDTVGGFTCGNIVVSQCVLT